MPGHCHEYKSKLHFSLNSPAKLYEVPDTDMSQVVYTTQGKLDNHSISQKYAKHFQNQCKYNMPLKYSDFQCPQTCKNNLSTSYISDKVINTKYYN